MYSTVRFTWKLRFSWLEENCGSRLFMFAGWESKGGKNVGTEGVLKKKKENKTTADFKTLF